MKEMVKNFLVRKAMIKNLFVSKALVNDFLVSLDNAIMNLTMKLNIKIIDT